MSYLSKREREGERERKHNFACAHRCSMKYNWIATDNFIVLYIGVDKPQKKQKKIFDLNTF